MDQLHREQRLKRSWLRFPYYAVRGAYKYVFARPPMQVWNDALLDLALNARGYKNRVDPEKSGESLFIDLVARNNPRLCIDIGANKGAYAATLLQRTNASVICFEPLPQAFGSLLKLKERYPGRLQAVNVGVADKQGELELYYGSEDSELASFSKEVSQVEYVGRHNVNVMKVSVVTLDGYFKEHFAGTYDHLDLLKIDTEGYEYEVLMGARETIASMRPTFIQIEYNWHQLFRGHSLFRFAELLPDYRAYQLLPHGSGLAPRDPRSPESNIFHYSNFVFVRGDVELGGTPKR